MVGQVQQLVAAALAAVEAGALAEADARDLAKQQLAYGSTGDWVTHLAGLRRGEGKRRVARAKALVGPLSRTREALVAGACSPEPGRRDRGRRSRTSHRGTGPAAGGRS